MGATDAYLARLQAEIEQRHKFIDGLVEDAETSGRDLATHELERITKERDRIKELDQQIPALQDISRAAIESRARTAEITRQLTAIHDPESNRSIEYRSAGIYMVDYWRARLGQEEAAQRIDMYHRAAAHQTTGDNAGLIPDPILGPVVSFVDQSRPLVNFFGAKQLPSGSWSRPKVTQHTQVSAQSAEKTELVSRKMLISKLAVTPVTYGGYVNVSRQNVDWSQPQVMDIVINDLASQYAIETENAFADALMAAATAETAIPTGPATAAQVAASLWTAVGNVYTAMKGAGRVFQAVSPDMLGLIGPLFAPVNPTNAQSPGFSAADFAQGVVGQISGVPVLVSAGLNAGSWLVGSTAAAEVYEERVGALQVIEPSVLGVQVAYAGYFSDIVIEATGLRKIAKTP